MAAALARVAWPHSFASVVGVNHRRPKLLALATLSLGSIVWTKAVFDRLFSIASSCSVSVGMDRASPSRKKTAAELPPKALFVNASTCA